MVSPRLGAVLDERLGEAGFALPPNERDALWAYLDVLARWNRKINLTSHDLDAPNARAVDRLVIEPLIAAGLIRDTDRRAIDIGSGGGSPSVPIAVHCPYLHVTMVESRGRKAAFLREVVRTLELNAQVETSRFESFAAASGGLGFFDVVTFRAVRPDKALLDGVDRVLAASGMVLALGSSNVPDSRFGFRAFPGGICGVRHLVE